MHRLRIVVTHPGLALMFRVYLAGIFIYASLHKITFPAEFADNVASYVLVPYWLLNPMAVFMPWVELVAGLFLLAGVRVRAASMIIGALLAVFTVAVIIALIQDTPIGCGCFQDSVDPISWLTVLRDVTWMAMAAHVYRYDSFIHLDRVFSLNPEELGL